MVLRPVIWCQPDQSSLQVLFMYFLRRVAIHVFPQHNRPKWTFFYPAVISTCSIQAIVWMPDLVLCLVCLVSCTLPHPSIFVPVCVSCPAAFLFIVCTMAVPVQAWVHASQVQANDGVHFGPSVRC